MLVWVVWYAPWSAHVLDNYFSTIKNNLCLSLPPPPIFTCSCAIRVRFDLQIRLSLTGKSSMLQNLVRIDGSSKKGRMFGKLQNDSRRALQSLKFKHSRVKKPHKFSSEQLRGSSSALFLSILAGHFGWRRRGSVRFAGSCFEDLVGNHLVVYDWRQSEPPQTIHRVKK